MVKKINNSVSTVRGMILGLCTLFVCGQLAASQPAEPAAPPAPPATAAAPTAPARDRAMQLTAPPGAEASMSAFRALDGWVRAWRVPSAPEFAADPARALHATTAACITLRLRGETIARAEALSASLVARAPDQSDLIRRAAEDALAQAAPRLNVPNDAMRDEAIRAVAKDITISLELAGPFTQTEPETWGDVDATWKPGLDGVAVRTGNADATAGSGGTTNVVFPSTMLASNMIPSRALSSAAAQAIGEGGAAAALDEPKKLRSEHGLKMYRFRVTHLSQSRANAPPEFLHRGARLIPAGEVMTVGGLREMAANLAAHLVEVAKGLPEGQLTPREVEEISFARLALAEFLRMVPTDAAGQSKTKQAIAALDLRVFRWQEARAPEGSDVILAASALVSGAPVEHPNVNTVWIAYHGNEERSVFSIKLPPEKRGLFAMGYLLAIRELPSLCGQDTLMNEVSMSVCIRDTFKNVPEGALASQMPWLGWAAVRSLQPDQPIPSAIALRSMRALCWQHQFSLADAGGAAGDDADLIGGIVFTAPVAEGRSSPYPTWPSVRPLAFIATMLGDARLTEPAERPREIVHLMSSLRFLRQLQVDESSAWMYSDPQRAMGGIRASVWDTSQPVEATALTLLCVVETLSSFEALAAPPKPPATEPTPAR